MTCVATGMPVPAFNPTFVVRPPRDPAGSLQRVRDLYMRCGLAGEVIAWDDTAHAIDDATTGAGCPDLDRNLIETEMLTAQERTWLGTYHRTVREVLKAHL